MKWLALIPVLFLVPAYNANAVRVAMIKTKYFFPLAILFLISFIVFPPQTAEAYSSSNILFDAQLTTTDTTATTSYENINGMASGSVLVGGTGSLIIIQTTVTFDSDSADSGCWVGIHVDGLMVAEAKGGVDANANEPASVHVAWAETGLSTGNHDFDIRFKEESGSFAGCIIDVDTTRSVQVIEFLSTDITFSIRANDTSTSSDTSATTSFTVVDNLTETFTTVSGAVYLILASVSMQGASGSADVSCEFGVFIGVTPTERYTAKGWSDAVSEGGNAGLWWWEDSLGASSQTFEIQWKEEQVECETRTDTQRHMQVIEFSGTGVPSILSEQRAVSSQTFNSSYQNMTSMDVTPTIAGTDSLVFASATAQAGTSSSDNGCRAQLRTGGVARVSGEQYADATDEEGSTTLVHVEVGVSGSRNYDLQARNGNQGTCVGANSPTPTPQNSIQVVEFVPAGGAPVVNIDLYDVYESESTTLGSGIAMCTAVDADTAGQNCDADLLVGHTYRFEFEVDETAGNDFTPSSFDLDVAVNDFDVLGDVDFVAVGNYVLNSGCEDHTDWTESYVGGTDVRATAGTTTNCVINSGSDTSDEFWVIIRIHSSAGGGTNPALTFTVTDGTVSDTCTSQTFRVINILE